MTVKLGDCGEVMSRMDAASVDAIVTDPPYGLSFMGKGWDHGVPGVEYWDEAWRVIKPGAYLLAFGGTRTFHRLTVAIEDADFEIHDCLSWLYGSGFPKHKSKLKPAWEPIIVARKAAAQATPLNVDACRLEPGAGISREGEASAAKRYTAGGNTGFAAMPGTRGGDARGRWPANVVLDEDAAAALDEQSGELTSGANPTRRGSPKFRNTYGEFAGQEACEPARGVDVGGASRFYYCAKASRAEREAGLDAFADRPLLWSAGTQNPGSFQSEGTKKSSRNNHPTVKPLSLMRWLVRLVTPPNGLVLDPFAGSGTTGCAAALEGFDFIGIEQDEHYAAIANARIAHARASLTPSIFADGAA